MIRNPSAYSSPKFLFSFIISGTRASMVKNLPAMQDSWVQSPGWKDPLENEMATHSNSCLENPMDRGAWQAIVQGIA